MTLLDNKETNPAETKQEDKKAIIVRPDPEPKLKAFPKKWNEACELCEMHSYCRPHKSKAEGAFIAKYIVPLKVTFDKSGNAHKVIGNAPVIWSCHTDTVHLKQGSQKIVYWTEGKDDETFIGVRADQKSSCLGADDTAGIWILINMIKAKVPGHYIFHRGEECGGIGSRWLAKEQTEMLKGYKYAIAFDRKDTKSIITHQGGKKTCSDEFAKLLAAQIGMDHAPDSTGMWTDTAAYVDEIAECTNISVGYYDAHSCNEKLNIDYLFKLRDAMCKIDVTKFEATRKPGDNAWKSYQYEGVHRWYGQQDWPDVKERPAGGYSRAELDTRYGYNDWYQWYTYDCKTGWWSPIKGVIPPNPNKWRKNRRKRFSDEGVIKGWANQTKEAFESAKELRELKLLIQDNPAIIAELLEGQGYGPLEIREYIRGCHGLIYDDYLGM